MGTQTEKKRQERDGRRCRAPARQQGTRPGGGCRFFSHLAWGTSSFGRLHWSAENFRQNVTARNTGNRLDLDRARRINATTLPTRDCGFVDRRIKQQTERLKRQLVRFTIQSDGGTVFHADSSCISCNISQAASLHVAITNWNTREVMVVQ